MKNMSIFQIVLLGLFIFFIIGAVIALALYRGGKKGTEISDIPITVWGGTDDRIISGYLKNYFEKNGSGVVTYVVKRPEFLEADLIAAIADGRQPDLIIFPHDYLFRLWNRLANLSYEYFPRRDFQDNFINEAELFLGPKGIYALPLAIDPLVLYWNVDVFTAAGLPKPPQFWEEMPFIVSRLLVRSENGRVIKPAAALGEFTNVNHAKDIVSTLFLQAGTDIVINDGVSFQSVLSRSIDKVMPAASALSFYSDFANPRKSIYTWNKSFPYAKDMFLRGDLPIYFGYASEYQDLKSKNPNLNFDVALMPQLKQNQKRATFGRLYGVAVVRLSRNIAAAYSWMNKLTEYQTISNYANFTGLPPVYKGLLFSDKSDAVRAVFDQSAFWARGWYDPLPKETDRIWGQMVESVIAGELPSRAVKNADNFLKELVGG
jgi:ABC-type glycerol-3-phosphate transport system substrate-binding protein